ncbi:hypothetical protein CAEBREN_16380 [Caenorhabditis brenneri]|uniref:Uncharacterized protein n=1 Tax=Caenorhabditis brenneri TaxID=135651 RepID=G0NGJ0_CAEBE|nr:hypothetical protein CAEBREN_16380 [Caenorhabditis brenneri]
MYTQTLIDFLRERMDRLFLTWPVDILNSRLRRLGKQRVSFNHRGGEEHCFLRLHTISPRFMWFYWEEEQRFVCVTDYMQIKYGRRPVDCALMVELVGVRPGELLPLDFVNINLV